MKIKHKIKVGETLKIYTDFKEERDYEGIAILLEKVGVGNSFYLENERLLISDKKQYTKEDLEKIRKYNYVKTCFHGNEFKKNTKDFRKLHKDLVKHRKNNLNDHNKMDDVLNEYRKEYEGTTHKMSDFFANTDNDYIIRFVQQHQRNWRTTIFNSEKWKLKFIEDKDGWETDWITSRHIRKIVCVNPKDTARGSEITLHTTYNGKSSLKGYKNKK